MVLQRDVATRNSEAANSSISQITQRHAGVMQEQQRDGEGPERLTAAAQTTPRAAMQKHAHVSQERQQQQRAQTLLHNSLSSISTKRACMDT